MIRKIYLLLVVALFVAKQGMAQEWIVPDDQKNVKNPLEFNLQNVKKGKDLFMANCKSCHGDPGKHNALPLVPAPPDVTSEIMQANSEAELFYKMTNGRGTMPQFGKTISEDDRWRLVNFIHNYNPNVEPVLVEAPPQKAKLLASVNEVDRTVEIFAEVDNKKGGFEKLRDAEVKISEKKAFGNLPIGVAVTNVDGRAEYKLPETLIGDEKGLVNIVVELGDGFITDQVILDAAKVGQPKPQPKLIQKEVLWSTNDNIQTWLLLSYLGAVGAAWFAIGYVIFLIFKIRKAGK